MVIASSRPDIEIPDVSVYDFILGDLAEADLDRPAVADGASGAVTSYGELLGQVNAIAGAIAARGIGVGDVVALHAPNAPAFVAAFHGILRAGATVTTVNAIYVADEIASQLRDAAAKLLITVSPLLPSSGPAAEAVPAEV